MKVLDRGDPPWEGCQGVRRRALTRERRQEREGGALLNGGEGQGARRKNVGATRAR